MENDNFTPQIDKYLNRQMSEREQAAFEKEIANNDVLSKEIRTHILEREAVNALLEKQYKEKIRKMRAGISTDTEAKNTTSATSKAVEMRPEKHSRLSVLRQSFAIAASILVLLLVGVSWYANHNFDNETLALNQYLMADAPGDKGGNKTLQADFESGLQAFFSDDYTTAVLRFEAVPQTEQEYLEAQYYLGHSLFQQEQFAAAVPYFEYVLAQNNLPAYINRDKLQWNKLLAMAGSGQTGPAFQDELNEVILKGKTPYREKANELNEDLNSFWRWLIF